MARDEPSNSPWDDEDGQGIEARDVEDDGEFDASLLEDIESGNPDESNAPIEENNVHATITTRDVEDDAFDASLLEDLETRDVDESNAPIEEDDETIEARDVVEPSNSPWDGEDIEAREVDASVDEEGFY